MHEELQSTNDELQTIKAELRQRGEELNAADALLPACLSGDSAIEQVVRDAVRRASPFAALWTCNPLMGSQNGVRGVNP